MLLSFRVCPKFSSVKWIKICNIESLYQFKYPKNVLKSTNMIYGGVPQVNIKDLGARVILSGELKVKTYYHLMCPKRLHFFYSFLSTNYYPTITPKNGVLSFGLFRVFIDARHLFYSSFFCFYFKQIINPFWST